MRAGEVKIFKARFGLIEARVEGIAFIFKAGLVAFHGMNRRSDFGKAGFAFIGIITAFARCSWAVWSCGSVSASALAISASSALRAVKGGAGIAF